MSSFPCRTHCGIFLSHHYWNCFCIILGNVFTYMYLIIMHIKFLNNFSFSFTHISLFPQMGIVSSLFFLKVFNNSCHIFSVVYLFLVAQAVEWVYRWPGCMIAQVYSARTNTHTAWGTRAPLTHSTVYPLSAVAGCRQATRGYVLPRTMQEFPQLFAPSPICNHDGEYMAACRK